MLRFWDVGFNIKASQILANLQEAFVENLRKIKASKLASGLDCVLKHTKT